MSSDLKRFCIWVGVSVFLTIIQADPAFIVGALVCGYLHVVEHEHTKPRAPHPTRARDAHASTRDG